MTLIPKLEELAHTIDDQISKVNRGGCCVVASLVALHLQHVVPVRGVVFDEWGRSNQSIDEVRPLIHNNNKSEWNDNGVNFGHVKVEFDYGGTTYQFDSDGVTLVDHNTIDCDQIPGYLNVDELIYLAADTGWNSWFNRDQIPKLHSLINKTFSDMRNNV